MERFSYSSVHSEPTSAFPKNLISAATLAETTIATAEAPLNVS